jgi:hypothetical protein
MMLEQVEHLAGVEGGRLGEHLRGAAAQGG